MKSLPTYPEWTPSVTMPRKIGLPSKRALIQAAALAAAAKFCHSLFVNCRRSRTLL